MKLFYGKRDGEKVPELIRENYAREDKKKKPLKSSRNERFKFPKLRLVEDNVPGVIKSDQWMSLFPN